MQSYYAIYFFILICLVVTGVLLLRYNEKKKQTEQERHTLSVKSSIVLESFKNIPFNDALSINVLANKSKDQAINVLNNSTGEIARQGLEIAEVISSKGKILAEFPEHIKQSINAAEAAKVVTKDGNAILVARDIKTGKFIAHAKEVNPTTVSKMAKVGNIIVGAAHIISGYDIAKKVSLIAKDVDLLLVHRNNDMVAELESIYETIQELEHSSIERNEVFLRQLKTRLKTLRNSWLREVTHSLSSIDDPNSVNVIKRFFRNNTKTGQKLSSKVNSLQAPLYITRLALEMEKSVATLLNEEDIFINQTIPNQKQKIIHLKDLINERKGWIDNLCKDDGESSNLAVEASDNFIKSIKYKKAS